jgi:hypothetical protein
MSHLADQYIKHRDLPRGIVRSCAICTFADTVIKPRPGTAGRGWGMREGNKQRGRLIQHIKAEHPEVLS